MTSLEKAIITTVAYFDLSDYPLTSTEIWRWLWKPEEVVTLSHIQDLLISSPELAQRLTRVEGFYCLKGREHIVPQRKEANLRADKQMRRLRRYVRLFSLVPSVQTIMITSSLARGNVSEHSDVDLIVIAKRGQIWVTRLFLVAILKLLNKRPRPGHTSDTYCLTFYIADSALNVSGLMMDQDDAVFTYYAEGCIPVFNSSGVYEKFWQANQWIYKLLPHAAWSKATIAQYEPGRLMRWWRWLMAPLFTIISRSPFNDLVIRLQLLVMPEHLKSLANVDTRVVVNDFYLKFHDKDNRRELREHWHKNLSSLLADDYTT